MYWLSIIFISTIFFVMRLFLQDKATHKGLEWFKSKNHYVSPLKELELRENAEGMAMGFLLLPFLAPFIILGIVNVFTWKFLSLLIIFILSLYPLTNFIWLLVKKERKTVTVIDFFNYCWYPDRFPYQPDWPIIILFLIVSPLLSVLIIVGHFLL